MADDTLDMSYVEEQKAAMRSRLEDVEVYLEGVKKGHALQLRKLPILREGWDMRDGREWSTLCTSGSYYQADAAFRRALTSPQACAHCERGLGHHPECGLVILPDGTVWKQKCTNCMPSGRPCDAGRNPMVVDYLKRSQTTAPETAKCTTTGPETFESGTVESEPVDSTQPGPSSATGSTQPASSSAQ